MLSFSSLSSGPVGVFDSGYGGLTILAKIRELMPHNDYIYLGDNARTPYGTRSFEVVYEFTLQAVRKLFELGCPLVILPAIRHQPKLCEAFSRMIFLIWIRPAGCSE